MLGVPNIYWGRKRIVETVLYKNSGIEFYVNVGKKLTHNAGRRSFMLSRGTGSRELLRKCSNEFRQLRTGSIVVVIVLNIYPSLYSRGTRRSNEDSTWTIAIVKFEILLQIIEESGFSI